MLTGPRKQRWWGQESPGGIGAQLREAPEEETCVFVRRAAGAARVGNKPPTETRWKKAVADGPVPHLLTVPSASFQGPESKFPPQTQGRGCSPNARQLFPHRASRRFAAQRTCPLLPSGRPDGIAEKGAWPRCPGTLPVCPQRGARLCGRRGPPGLGLPGLRAGLLPPALESARRRRRPHCLGDPPGRPRDARLLRTRASTARNSALRPRRGRGRRDGPCASAFVCVLRERARVSPCVSVHVRSRVCT